MKNVSSADKKRLKELNAQIKDLQEQLVVANKLDGRDDYIAVKVKKNQGRFRRIKKKGQEDKGEGEFYIEIDITAKQQDVFIPLSVASGKKVAGFMYQIEGTGPGSIVTTSIKVRGDKVSNVTLGTLLYAKIPTGKTATFRIQATIGGRFNEQYKIVFVRINYKLQLTEVQYHQYLKELHSETVSFS
jgi:hypothetical protein